VWLAGSTWGSAKIDRATARDSSVPAQPRSISAAMGATVTGMSGKGAITWARTTSAA
jgi:hypothetical protein